MNEEIRRRIEEIEEAYEFMLAYAAQGRAEEGADGTQIRNFLTRFGKAAAAIPDMLETIAAEESVGFLARFREDSKTMASVIEIMLARGNISSEVVDNANGLIAVRSYLTSLFFLDKAVLA